MRNEGNFRENDLKGGLLIYGGKVRKHTNVRDNYTLSNSKTQHVVSGAQRKQVWVKVLVAPAPLVDTACLQLSSGGGVKGMWTKALTDSISSVLIAYGLIQLRETDMEEKRLCFYSQFTDPKLRLRKNEKPS